MALIQNPDFHDMTIGKLREYASHLRLPIAKTATKVEILEQIERKLKGRSMPELATPETRLKPGHSRIRIAEDPSQNGKDIPVYLNANGYQCTIPRGVEVVVPNRVVRVLNDAVAYRKKQTEGGPGQPLQEKTVAVLSYPFQVLEMAPGEEPLTKLEESKKKSMAPRRRYREMFGYWPKPREMSRAIEKGIISLKEDETLQESVEALFADSSNNT